MTEFIGLAYFAEIPVTSSTSSAAAVHRHADAHAAVDILSCAYASHGDTKHVMLFPEDPAECFRMRAARPSTSPTACRRPVFVMTDLTSA